MTLEFQKAQTCKHLKELGVSGGGFAHVVKGSAYSSKKEYVTRYSWLVETGGGTSHFASSGELLSERPGLVL